MAGELSANERAKERVGRWLAAAVADAERHGLENVLPLLDGLSQSTVALRTAEWNDTLLAGGRATREEVGGGRSSAEGGR